MLIENENRNVLCTKWVGKAKLSVMIKSGHKNVLMKL